MKHVALIERIRFELDKNIPLKVDYYFVFPKSKLLTKDNRFKMLDSANRIKSCQDGLASIIGIDDKMFVTGVVEKVICDEDKEAHVIIHIQESVLRKYDDIIALQNR